MRGSYPVAGVMGGLAQMARRLLFALALVLLGALIWFRPRDAFVRGAVTVAVLLALFGLRAAWARASARWGINRCYLYTGGLVVTSIFGRVREAVRWDDVREVNRLTNQSVLLAFHRIEIVRRDYGTVTFLALGLQPALVEALLNEVDRNATRS
ncbi:hypothetical protein NFX46_22955 [Streptomyces phaeoluteigriseus]|uniref:DUF304 domain-containing protein n=1 Tax=Streptomyces phaeoluteigriseus TaxID=114686 RepID=A0ABY4ZBV8_9ACTN|nr:hypothetical protein [Streptomyces phaeoluteigriseus]USQ86314.1 hypothetical protein NFX46_22955 [Streptomyces phaeoluteigriseus]